MCYKVSWPGSTSHDTLPHRPLHPLPPPIIIFLIDFKFPATQCMSFRNSADYFPSLFNISPFYSNKFSLSLYIKTLTLNKVSRSAAFTFTLCFIPIN